MKKIIIILSLLLLAGCSMRYGIGAAPETPYKKDKLINFNTCYTCVFDKDKTNVINAGESIIVNLPKYITESKHDIIKDNALKNLVGGLSWSLSEEQLKMAKRNGIAEQVQEAVIEKLKEKGLDATSEGNPNISNSLDFEIYAYNPGNPVLRLVNIFPFDLVLGLIGIQGASELNLKLIMNTSKGSRDMMFNKMEDSDNNGLLAFTNQDAKNIKSLSNKIAKSVIK